MAHSICPKCGLKNINGRTICKVCRSPLNSTGVVNTSHLLSSKIKQHLQLSGNKGLVLDGQNLQGEDLSGLDLSSISMRRVDLRNANLQNANLSGCNLEDADLRGGDLSFATLNNATMRHARCDGAVFKKSTALAVDFSGASLKDVNFEGSNLSDSKFETVMRNDIYHSTSLINANLGGCNLHNTKISAFIQGANLVGSDLQHCFFKESSYDSHTKWPQGFSPQLSGAAYHDLAKSDLINGRLWSAIGIGILISAVVALIGGMNAGLWVAAFLVGIPFTFLLIVSNLPGLFFRS